ncbi:MAG TPA: class I SAM-dependent methyltransferase [Nitrospirota bacterium]|nr:class I SAM-dependent methyltransferase [Nitrospirota bacterium]
MRCLICDSEAVIELLNFGMQPLCNRFPESPNGKEYLHQMILGQCSTCGLIQISKPVPSSELSPRYDWITYNEPEGHLDSLAEIVSKLSGLTQGATILGVSYKDDSTLRRLEERNFTNIRRLDPAEDLGIFGKKPEIETIQDRLTPEAANKIVRRYGHADIVIARHIVEHAHNIRRFMEALKQLLKPQGYIVFESPDCAQSLEKLDYSMPWEEHILYFTLETFQNGMHLDGLTLVHFECYPYPLENSLVGILRFQEGVRSSSLSEGTLEREKKRFRAYSEGLPRNRIRYKEFLSNYRQHQGKIALLGAGHLACTFINLLELREYIEFVVDDNPKKQGLLMPGSLLPIRGSKALIEEGIKLCLLTVAPESEEKVIQRNRDFIEKGGMFASIFPASKNALRFEQ